MIHTSGSWRKPDYWEAVRLRVLMFAARPLFLHLSCNDSAG